MAEPKRQDLEGEGVGREAGSRFAAAVGVAATLRTARIATGLDLAQVADALRIQYRYLEAIEAGRFEDLPGPAYALGFVRAYAEFLRLDGKLIIRKFKDEVRGLSRRQALVFPEPLQEGRFPGGVVLLVAVLFAAGVYGGWYYWEHRQLTAVDTVPPVPASLANMVPVPAAPQPMAPSEAQAGSAAAVAVEETQAAAGSALPPGPDAAAPAPQANSAAPAAAGAPAATASPASAAPIILKPPAGMGVPGAAAPSAVTAAAGGQATAAPPPAPEQIANLKAGDARIYGETNVDSRITLIARQDSWVQVRDHNGNVIWTRILRPGDAYRAPNQAGLSFATGNAGALDVSVDGKTAPSLGGAGVVRHNIPLDPEKLLSGTLPSQ